MHNDRIPTRCLKPSFLDPRSLALFLALLCSAARMILARLAAHNTHACGLRCRPAPLTGPHRPVRTPPRRRRSPQGLGMRAAAALAGLRAATPCPAAAPAPSLPLKLPQLPQPAHSRPACHRGLRSRWPACWRPDSSHSPLPGESTNQATWAELATGYERAGR